jgi:hypothetical protein
MRNQRPSNTVLTSVMAEQAHHSLVDHNGRQVKTQYCSWKMPVYRHQKLLILTLSRTSNKSMRMIWMLHGKKEHAISPMLKEIWRMHERGLELWRKLQRTTQI